MNLKRSLILFAMVWTVGLVAQNANVNVQKPAFEHARFQMFQLSNMRQDQYLLDTETGRVWQIAMGKNGSTILQSVPFVDEDGLTSNLPDSDKEVAYAVQVRDLIRSTMRSTKVQSNKQ